VIVAVVVAVVVAVAVAVAVHTVGDPLKPVGIVPTALLRAFEDQ